MLFRAMLFTASIQFVLSRAAGAPVVNQIKSLRSMSALRSDADGNHVLFGANSIIYSVYRKIKTGLRFAADSLAIALYIAYNINQLKPVTVIIVRTTEHCAS
jgi:hypothetical protein